MLLLTLLLTFLLSILGALSTAQTCSTSSCSLACNTYQTVFTHCNYDYQPSDNLVTCLCKYEGGLQGNVQTLAQCVVCDQDGLASDPLSSFQIMAVICAAYAESGEQAALSVNSMSTAAIIGGYSSTILPALQSTVCSGDSGSSTMAPPGPTASSNWTAAASSAASQTSAAAASTSSSAAVARAGDQVGVIDAVSYVVMVVVAML